MYTGSGTGTYSSPVVTAAGNGVAANTNANSIVAGDFTNNGLSDVAFVTDNGNLRRRHAGHQWRLDDVGDGRDNANEPRSDRRHHRRHDYNGDGDLDLIVEVA